MRKRSTRPKRHATAGRVRSGWRAKPERSAECRAIFRALSEFVDGTLPARDCRELRKHFENCQPCVEYLRSLESTIRACRAYQSSPAPPVSSSVRKAFQLALERAESSGKP
jgi:anti-sigma factor RsiW